MATQPSDRARSDAYQRQVTATRTTALVALLALFRRGSYRSADSKAFIKAAEPLVRASRRQVASLTIAHLTQRLQELHIPFGVPEIVDTNDLRGVPISEVYERPFKTVWIDLAKGEDLPSAVKAAEVRLTSLIETDLELAKTHAAQSVLKGTPKTTLFHRVLKGPENCALCVVASTQVYTRGDLMPIHPGCDCDIDVITDIAKFRTEGVDRLREAHEAVNKALGVDDVGARKPDYRKLVTVHEHGEYGPTLAVTAHRFTDKAAARTGGDISNLPRAK